MNKQKSRTSLDLFLGKKLKDFRERVGWSQTKLAEKAGISHQQIFKYEQGYATIPTHKLFKFTKIFGVTPNSFFEGFELPRSEALTNEMLLVEQKEVINVLLIDDDSREELVIRQALASLKHQLNVYCLRNYEEVSKFLRRQFITSPFPRPDIILLDIKSQKVNGLTILKSLKQDYKTKEIPVIVLTTSLDKEDVIMAYKNHASGYINKSFDSEVFQQNLKIAIDYWAVAVVLPVEPSKVA